MAPRVLIALVAALALGACGQESSSAEFAGAEQQVADVIEAFQEQAQQGNGDEICQELLTEELQRQLSAPNSTCGDQLDEAIADADARDLEVEDVTISGTRATARVRAPDEGEGVVRTFELVRVGDAWRIAGFGAAQG